MSYSRSTHLTTTGTSQDCRQTVRQLTVTRKLDVQGGAEVIAWAATAAAVIAATLAAEMTLLML